MKIISTRKQKQLVVAIIAAQKAIIRKDWASCIGGMPRGRMMKQVIVKPCPFCGNPATVREALKEERPKWSGTYGGWWIVECSNEYCLMHPKFSFPNKHGAVLEWNTRRKANRLTYDPQENIVEFER